MAGQLGKSVYRKRPYGKEESLCPVKTLADLYKAKFFRRSWYRATKKTTAAKLPLTGSDLQELLSFLDKYPVGVRLVLNGVNREGQIG